MRKNTLDKLKNYYIYILFCLLSWHWKLKWQAFLSFFLLQFLTNTQTRSQLRLFSMKNLGNFPIICPTLTHTHIHTHKYTHTHKENDSFIHYFLLPLIWGIKPTFYLSISVWFSSYLSISAWFSSYLSISTWISIYSLCLYNFLSIF